MKINYIIFKLYIDFLVLDLLFDVKYKNHSVRHTSNCQSVYSEH